MIFSNYKIANYNLKNFDEIFTQVANSSPKPITIKVVLNNSDFDHYIQLEAPQLIGDLVHRTIPGFYPVIFLIWISGYFFEILSNILTITHNKRWDKALFLGLEANLDKLLEERWFQKLGHKIAISLDSISIWVNPYVYNGGKMYKISDILDKPPSNPYYGGQLRGRHTRGVFFELGPWHYKSGEIDGEIQYDGSYIRILKEMGKFYNFTYDLLYTGNNYGDYKNGTWGGALGYIVYPELGVDYALSMGVVLPLHNLVDRASDGLITGCTWIGFITQHGKRIIPWYANFLPFTLEVWLYTLLTIIVLGLVQSITIFLKKNYKLGYFVLDVGTFQPFSLIMEQGLTNIPNGLRNFSCLILLAGMILGTGYKSTLRTNITFPKKEEIPITFEDLGKRPDYSPTFYSLGSIELDLIRHNKDMIKMWNRTKFIFQEDPEPLVKHTLLNDKTAFIFWSPLVDTVIARSFTLNPNVKSLVHSKDNCFKLANVIAFQPNSILADSFSGPSFALFESGIYEKFDEWVNREVVKAGSESVKTEKKVYEKLLEIMNWEEFGNSPLTVENLKITFAIIPIGFFFSFILFYFEFKLFNNTS